MVLRPEGLPRFLVLEPRSTLRLELRIRRPPFELTVDLPSSASDRSFVLMLGPPGGPLRQRLRLRGRTRILFEPRDRRGHLLVLVNPDDAPLVLELRGRSPSAARRAGRPRRLPSTARAVTRPDVRVRPLPLAPPSLPRASSGIVPTPSRLRGGRPKG